MRFVCQRLGYTGGLKNVEKLFNIRRDGSVEDLSGEDAVYLWQKWRATRNSGFLDKLIQYNTEDVVNLLPLAERLVPELWNKIRFPQ